MVAARLALPWAVEKSVRVGVRILVEIVVPGRLTFTAEAARSKGRRKRESILSDSGHHICVEVLRGHKLRAITHHAENHRKCEKMLPGFK